MHLDSCTRLSGGMVYFGNWLDGKEGCHGWKQEACGVKLGRKHGEQQHNTHPSISVQHTTAEFRLAKMGRHSRSSLRESRSLDLALTHSFSLERCSTHTRAQHESTSRKQRSNTNPSHGQQQDQQSSMQPPPGCEAYGSCLQLTPMKEANLFLGCPATLKGEGSSIWKNKPTRWKEEKYTQQP
ncbi:hypothetical protein VIGAN_06153400 [Vigna angularis var. angularis]|nr:hypothetical protein VIGAN_06153400 [Vigna angularis var. angularis]